MFCEKTFKLGVKRLVLLNVIIPLVVFEHVYVEEA